MKPLWVSRLSSLFTLHNQEVLTRVWPQGRTGLFYQKSSLLLQVPLGTCNPNLQVVIMHASHVCIQHSFGLPLTMNGRQKNAIWLRVFQPSTPRNLISWVLTICHTGFKPGCTIAPIPHCNWNCPLKNGQGDNLSPSKFREKTRKLENLFARSHMVVLWKGGVRLPVIKKGIEVYKGMPGWRDFAVKCVEV